MKYVSLPDERPHLLPFYLSMEEYVARNFDCGELFFMWQVEPTVIFGRNQLVSSEVNIDYCTANGIRMFRRKSGGGCVYADMDNIMLSYITESESVITTFSHYTSMVAEVLRSIGINADNTSRNDILINGLKVSGNAFYHIPHKSIAHGTMLYDTDIERMSNAITPSAIKLESKGVESVRSRITTIKNHIDISLEDFKAAIRQRLCGNNELKLTNDDVNEIEQMSKPYYSDEWIFGNNPRCVLTNDKRIENAGVFRTDIEISGDIIRKINLSGDFFVLSDIDTSLLDKLKGVKYSRADVAAAIAHLDAGETIYGLTNDNFVNLLF